MYKSAILAAFLFGLSFSANAEITKSHEDGRHDFVAAIVADGCDIIRVYQFLHAGDDVNHMEAQFINEINEVFAAEIKSTFSDEPDVHTLRQGILDYFSDKQVGSISVQVIQISHLPEPEVCGEKGEAI